MILIDAGLLDRIVKQLSDWLGPPTEVNVGRPVGLLGHPNKARYRGPGWTVRTDQRRADGMLWVQGYLEFDNPKMETLYRLKYTPEQN